MVVRSPSAALKMIWQKIPFHIKVTFFSALLAGIIVHAFMLTNKLPNSDDVSQLVHNMNQLRSGLWFLCFPAGISGIFSLPWVNGILSTLYIAVSACLLVSCFAVRDTVTCALTSGLMVSFPTITSTLTYMQASDGYGFSLLLACLSVWLAQRYRYGFAVAVLPLTLSLGIYQAYYGVAAGMFVMVLIFEILRNQTAWQKTLLKGLRFVCTLACSVILYLGIVKITTASTGLHSYMDKDQMGQIPLSELPLLIYRAYGSGFYYFVLDGWGLHFPFMRFVFAVLILLCCVLLALWCAKQGIHKEPLKLTLLLVLIALFPLACNIIFVMAPYGAHILMIYGTILLPLFALFVAALYYTLPPARREKGEHRKARWRSTVATLSCWYITAAIALSVFNYWILSNQAYLKLFFQYEHSYAQSVELISRVQGLDGYARGMEIVLLRVPDSLTAIPAFSGVELQGVLTRQYLLGPKFLNNYLGFTDNVTHIPNGVLEDAEVMAIVEEMPFYPDDGSVAIIHDKIYVKFPRASYNEGIQRPQHPTVKAPESESSHESGHE